MSAAPEVNNYDAFKQWLKSKGFSYKYTVNCIEYVRRYNSFLFGQRSLSEIETLKGKRHVLMALSNYAKFLGMYEEWRMLLKRYDIHWKSSSNSYSDIFSLLLGGKESVTEADAYIKELKDKVKDNETLQIIRFLALSGVRPSEACSIFNLVTRGELNKGYLDKELMLLQHFKYPNIFLRGGKKLFITVLTEKMINDLKNWESTEHETWYYEKLNRRLDKFNVKVNLYILRKAWATKMRMSGIESEIVDFFQGRVPSTIFVKSYFRPNLHEAINRIRNVLYTLEKEVY